jgi:glucokinase
MINIAADMGGTRIKLGLLKAGELLAATNLEALASESIEVNLARISEAARALMADHAIAKEQVNGIGLTFPGIVDSQQGRVLSQYVKYRNAHAFDFRAWARQEWNASLALENDARAALLGEWVKGAGKGRNNIVLLTLGTGVGSAVLLEGKLLRGVHFLAGNLGGHMSVNLKGRPCNCGFFGCLETEASTWALPEKAKMHPLFEESSLSKAGNIEFATLFQEAEKGDRLSAQLVEDCLKAWGVGVVNMVHAYDPELIIIGGGIMKKKGIILPYLQNMVDQYAWAPAAGSVKIVSAEQVEYAGLLGMDYMVSQLS